MNLKFKTPAKINLGLRILRKREDGYHELETLFQMVSLYDGVELESRPSGVDLECDAEGIPADGTNLVVRAACLLQKTFPGRCAGVRIRLAKTIPAGAGLGGGSGNAAGVLMGLNRLWDLRLTRDQLVPLAAQLGSDVPFFLTSPCAIGRGRGEKLIPLEPSETFYVVLVCPRFPIATSWVYGNLNLKLTKRENNISILQNFLSRSDIAGLGARLFNDLESVVIQRYPLIKTLKNALEERQALGALLSGSGSTVFGVFDRRETAQNACNGLSDGDWNLFLVETVRSFSEFFPEELLGYP